MAEIGTNVVLDGITLALRAAYPERHIEAGRVEQELRPPAFLVRLVSSAQATRGSDRLFRSPRFDVLFFPATGREECYAVADELCRVLEIIELPGGDKIRGTGITFEVVDDVLHMLVSYNYFTHGEKDEEYMEDLAFEQGGTEHG